MPDIDIDVADRTELLKRLRHVPARLETVPPRAHNTGVYFTDVPYDPVHGCASIDYETADARGYFKIDLLNVHVYGLIQDHEHYQAMQRATPPWARLWQDSEWASQLIHIGNYTELLESMRPDSIPRMAAFISIIRPGKAHLQNQEWSTVFESVWDGDDSRGFVFKKSHAVSYAALVALHMNLINFTD